MKKSIISLLMITCVVCAKEESSEQSQKPWYNRVTSWFTTEKVTLSTMSYDQLLVAKDAALEKKDTFTAIKYLERMSKVCTDPEALRGILLELANLLFDDGKFAKAYLLYDQYVKSYPGQTGDYSFAYYRKILSSYYQVLSIDRDQTVTEKTIELCEEFFKDCKNSTYEGDVKTIVQQCKKNLADHELDVINHYIKQNKVMSANHCIARVRNNYMHVSDVEFKLLNLEITLAEKVGNTQFAQARRQEIAEKFPEQKPVVVARSKELKTSMAHRF